MSAQNEPKNLESIKVVLMGDSGVGKTSIVNRYIKDTFANNLLSTAGVCFFSKLLKFEDINETCKLDVKINFIIKFNIQIWDTAGQERFKSITKIYYQKSDVILFIYDITNLDSFNNLKNIYNEVKQTVDLDKIFIFVVGNKNDLYGEESVKKDIAEQYANSINATYRCVSALSSSGIDELFECVGRKFFKKEEDEAKPKQTKVENDNNNQEFKLEPAKKNTKNKNGKKKCC